MKKWFTLSLFIAGIGWLLSCGKGDLPSCNDTGQLTFAGGKMRSASNVFYGPTVQVGNGTARSFIAVCRGGMPLEIGFELSDDALSGLPDGSDASTQHPEYVLSLHPKAKELTPFQHLVLNWNPNGHPPPGIFDKPHFDFHFYKISNEERMAIPPYSPSTAAFFDHFPPPGYLPSNYKPNPGGEAAMGKHWGDPSTWLPFIRTFIYGTYDGKVTFYEPMVTLEYLQSAQTSQLDISQPQLFDPVNRFYPTRYNVYQNPETHKHYISMSGFVWH